MRRAATVALLLSSWSCAGNAPEPEPVPAEVEAEVEEASVAPLARTTVEVYFPSAVNPGLIGEFREIFDTATAGDRAKQIIADLISGPTGDQALRAVPPGVRLRQAYTLDNGVMYLDFSAELTEGITGGSASEMLTIYSIVDSVVLNIAEIKRVAILVNGRQIETLNGHLDLRRPIPPDFTLVQGSILVEQREPASGGLTRTASLPPRP